MTNLKHYLDPRSKLVILILINIIVFSEIPFYIELICVSLICLGFIYQRMWKALLKCILQYAIILILNELFMYLPHMLAAMFGILIMVSRRLFPLLSFGKILLASPVGEMIAALQTIHVPKKLIVALTVVLRFFPTMREEYSSIRDAMKIRGIPLTVHNVICHPVVTTEYILVPTIQRFSVISEELSAAAVTRGIDSDRKRTSYYLPQLHMADYIFLFSYALLALICIARQVGVI